MVDLQELVEFVEGMQGERIFLPVKDGENIPLSKATLQAAIDTVVDQGERIDTLNEQLASAATVHGPDHDAEYVATRLYVFIEELSKSERKRFEKGEILGHLQEIVAVAAQPQHDPAVIALVISNLAAQGVEIDETKAAALLDDLISYGESDDDEDEDEPLVVQQPEPTVVVDAGGAKPLQPGADADEPGADGESANQARDRFLAAVTSGQLKPVGKGAPVDPERVLDAVERDESGRIHHAL